MRRDPKLMQKAPLGRGSARCTPGIRAGSDNISLLSHLPMPCIGIKAGTGGLTLACDKSLVNEGKGWNNPSSIVFLPFVSLAVLFLNIWSSHEHCKQPMVGFKACNVMLTLTATC